jgi:5'-3' exonuclease
MGILRFFGSVTENSITNLTDTFNKPLSNKLDITHLYFDFNSIVHVNSARVIGELNTLLYYIIANKMDKIGKLSEAFNRYGLSGVNTLDEFNKIMTDEFIDNLIVNEVLNYVYTMLKNVVIPDKIEFIYIAIDGVPSRAKMMEQKKRRYMGAVISNVKDKIKKKYENELSKFPMRSKYEKNKVEWSRNKISPGMVFMDKLNNRLNNKRFSLKISAICPNLKKYIFSGSYIRDEGEMKIMDHIMANKYNGGNYAIYSPDSDVILLSLLMNIDYSIDSKNGIPNLIMIRYNQQRGQYDVVHIEKLKKNIVAYVQNKLKGREISDEDIISDVVFIFAIFGNDFIPKVESFSVSTDFTMILDKYIMLLNENKSNIVLYNKKAKYKYINYDMFLKLVHILQLREGRQLQNVYLSNTYRNYKRLKEMMDIGDNDFVIVMNDFNELVKSFNYDIRSKGTHEVVNKWGERKYDEFIGKLVGILRWKEEGIDLIKKYAAFYKKNNGFPKLNVRLLRYARSLNDSYVSAKLERKFDYIDNSFDVIKYDEEVFKFENMMDEYVDKLDSYGMKLGRVAMDKTYTWKADDIKEGVKMFYRDYFHISKLDIKDNKMKNLLYEYLLGLTWAFESYFNRFEIMGLKKMSTWAYPYTKAPLMTQLCEYLNENEDKYMFDVLRNDVYKSYLPYDKFYNTIELLLYISPAKNMIEVMPKEYHEMIKNDKIYYTDINTIADDIMKSRHPIDCRGMIYLNKCHIKSDKKLSYPKFLAMIRKINMEHRTKELAGLFISQQTVYEMEYYDTTTIDSIEPKKEFISLEKSAKEDPQTKTTKNNKNNKNNNKKKRVPKRVDGKYTYMLKSKFYDNETFERILGARGNWVPHHESDGISPTFLYADSIYRQNVVKYTPKIKNILAKDKNIANKDKLFENLNKFRETNPEHYDKIKDNILDQYTFNLKDYIDKLDLLDKHKSLFQNGNKVWMFKPVDGAKGVGIKIFKDYELFKEYVDYIITEHRHTWKKGYKFPKFTNTMRTSYWVLQEYIMNPYLITHNKTDEKSYKFHLRIYLLIFSDKDGNKKGYICKVLNVGMSHKPYEHIDINHSDNEFDFKVHDSHGSGNINGLWFPESFKNEDNNFVGTIYEQAKNVLSVVLSFAHGDCYEESKHCYGMYGVDIMVTEDMKVKLIEINDNIGFQLLSKSNITTHLLEGIAQLVIDPLFPPLNKPTNEIQFIELDNIP